MIFLARNFRIDVQINIDEFINVVREDSDMTKVEIIKAINTLATSGRDYARANLEEVSKTWSLHKSVRTFSFKPPFGYVAIKGFSAGGYVINPDTGRLVDYAQALDEGVDHPEHQQSPFPFFTSAWMRVESEAGPKLSRAIGKAIRRR